ncbi:clan AA aspartic protease [Phormidesmis priestleyi]|uniref:clan AA aspartic protease n=1 Tax=Phormidesmis priestleyi TaxID=268141 RepID=UPI00294FF0DF|nr:clan AA aspartic protease [Phormidesmis priestleyi]
MISIVVKNGTKVKPVNAVIDTGFTGFLSLSSAIIAELELPWSYRDRATLGDGSETLFDIYEASVIWDGQFREIEINSANTEPLLGMRMLRGYRLQVDTVEGGLVTIAALTDVI